MPMLSIDDYKLRHTLSIAVEADLREELGQAQVDLAASREEVKELRVAIARAYSMIKLAGRRLASTSVDDGLCG